jgi:cytochrome c556
LARTDDTARRAQDYRVKLSAAEQAAGEFRARLRDTDVGAGMRDAAFQALGQACGACHRPYRN